MTHGFLFSSSARLKIEELRKLVLQAVANKEDVGVYFIDNGVEILDLSEVQALRKKEVKFYACALAAQKRKIPVNPKRALFGGLGILMNLILSSGKFTALTEQGTSSSKVKKEEGKISILMKILEDPAKSHVPVEALRVAAGLAASQQFKVFIAPSTQAAILFNDESSQEILDGEMLDHYLEILTRERVLVCDPKSGRGAVVVIPF
jgi:hypothetical protein